MWNVSSVFLTPQFRAGGLTVQEKASHSQHDLVKHRNILAKGFIFYKTLLYLFAWLLPFYGLQSDIHIPLWRLGDSRARAIFSFYENTLSWQPNQVQCPLNAVGGAANRADLSCKSELIFCCGYVHDCSRGKLCLLILLLWYRFSRWLDFIIRCCFTSFHNLATWPDSFIQR